MSQFWSINLYLSNKLTTMDDVFGSDDEGEKKVAENSLKKTQEGLINVCS